MDIQLRKTRDHQAAYAFMKRLVKAFGEPTVLTTDKAPALLCAFNKLKEQDFYRRTTHCTVKHLNNLIEQDHRHVKRRFAKSTGFQSLRHASRTLKGIETVHALYKQKRSLQQPNFVFSTYNELQQLLTIA
ncbi:DDE domain protein [Bacillus clarus]|uniref:DDE domain protein n=1 Tax=Bacillus clarus TaxID=2338372 RepID=A0A090Y8Y0_9BACI|nr:DDE domain protein [Bacillus clarus]